MKRDKADRAETQLMSQLGSRQTTSRVYLHRKKPIEGDTSWQKCQCSYQRRSSPHSLLIIATLWACSVAVARADTIYSFITIDDPNAFPGGTAVTGINDAGEVVGYFDDAMGNTHGFLRSSDGATFTTIDDPAALNGTLPFGINNKGQIAGMYIDNNCTNPITICANNGEHGFLRNLDGSFTNFDVPGAFDGHTIAWAINDSGEIAGGFVDNNPNNPSVYDFDGGHGFVRSSDGSNFKVIDIPGSTGTTAYGLNDEGQIVGDFANVFPSHAFSLDSVGGLTTFDDPATPSGTSTSAYGINDVGQIVGEFNPAHSFHGFVRNPDGSFIAIDDPFAPADNIGTVPRAINDEGQIAGYFFDSVGTHGFVATPSVAVTTPEPSTLVLLGTFLIGCASTLAVSRRTVRRRLRADRSHSVLQRFRSAGQPRRYRML